jgi:hypothetical protein
MEQEVFGPEGEWIMGTSCQGVPAAEGRVREIQSRFPGFQQVPGQQGHIVLSASGNHHGARSQGTYLVRVQLGPAARDQD